MMGVAMVIRETVGQNGTSYLAPWNEAASEAESPRVGLVLAGGGAKGAYEIGVLDYLAQIGCQVVAVAGTSGGALNGAVLAGQPSLAHGTRLLAALWEQFSEHLEIAPPLRGAPVAEATGERMMQQLRWLAPRLLTLKRSADALERLVDESVDFCGIRAGRALWVAAYPFSVGMSAPAQIRYLIEVFRRIGGSRSEILRLNDYPEAAIRDAVLASAALPFIFPPRVIGDLQYFDGAFGGRSNHALACALASEDLCDVLVIVHVHPRTVVHAELPNRAPCIDIWPSVPLAPAGPLGRLSGLLSFSPERVRTLRALGYGDARLRLEQFAEPVGGQRPLAAREKPSWRAGISALTGRGGRPYPEVRGRRPAGPIGAEVSK
jgi:NTE family protein